MEEPTQELKRLIDEIRQAFWRLAATADRAHADLGLTASTRAILEFIDEYGPTTVPRIADAKTVKRQSIQELVDRLREEGLIELAENPAHRRSRLVTLTHEGERIFREVRSRETDLLSQIAARLDRDEIAKSAATLSALRETLAALPAPAIRDVEND